MEKQQQYRNSPFSGTTSPTTPNAGDNRQASDGQVNSTLICVHRKKLSQMPNTLYGHSQKCGTL